MRKCVFVENDYKILFRNMSIFLFFSDESKMKMVEKQPISTLFQQTWLIYVSLDYVL